MPDLQKLDVLVILILLRSTKKMSSRWTIGHWQKNGMGKYKIDYIKNSSNTKVPLHVQLLDTNILKCKEQFKQIKHNDLSFNLRTGQKR